MFILDEKIPYFDKYTYLNICNLFLITYKSNSERKGGQVGVALLYSRLQVGHCNA